MAMDMFMKIANITGESKDSTYGQQIDVLAWSWGMSQSGTFHSGGGGGAGKANVQDMNFTKWIDNASPQLQLACLKGTHIDNAELIVRKAGDSPYEYLKITMTKVMVTACSTGGSGGEDRLTENVTLNFAKVKTEYFLQGDTGSVTTGPTYTWDIEANKAA